VPFVPRKQKPLIIFSWFGLLGNFGWQQLAMSGQEQFVTWWLRTWKMVLKGWRKAYDSLIFLVAWQLWLQRNAQTFQHDGDVMTLNKIVSYIVS
jgi:hypothetical protein